MFIIIVAGVMIIPILGIMYLSKLVITELKIMNSDKMHEMLNSDVCKE